MIIELEEFYPIYRDVDKERFSGTLRVRLRDLKLSLLGVFVTKKKEAWYFSVPCKNAVNSQGEWKRYPCIVFDDQELQRELMAELHRLGPAFIEQKIADTENPIIWPEPQDLRPKQPTQHKFRNEAMATKESVSVGHDPKNKLQKIEETLSKPTTTIQTKIFVDPPKIKARNKPTAAFGRR